MSFDFFAWGLHTRTALAHLSLRQLGFLVELEINSDLNSNCYRFIITLPSVLWHCWLGDRKGIRPVNTSHQNTLGIVV